MDRLNFSRRILQTELGFQPSQLDYIFAFPGRKIFEVVFTTFSSYELCVNRFNSKKSTTPCFQKILLTPLSERDIRTVTVLIHSERIKIEDVTTWLSMHCTILNTSLMRDEDGIKTGASKFQVRLRKDAEGNYHHLPALIQLGPIRGYVFYNGQPKECRKCGSLNHIAANCEMVICRHCNSKDHSSKDCQLPKKCNLCGAEDHRFRDCPHAYSNKIKQQDREEGRNMVDFEDPENNIRSGFPFVTHQDGAQDVTITQGEPSISPSLHPHGLVEVPAPSSLKEDLIDLSRVLFSPLEPNVNKRTEEETQKDLSVEEPEIAMDAMVSTPDKEGQKPRRNILLEVAEAFPLSLSLLSETPTPESTPNDNKHSIQEHEEVADWSSNSTPFLDFDEIESFSTTTQMKEVALPKESPSRSKREKKRKRPKSNVTSPT